MEFGQEMIVFQRTVAMQHFRDVLLLQSFIWLDNFLLFQNQMCKLRLRTCCVTTDEGICNELWFRSWLSTTCDPKSIPKRRGKASVGFSGLWAVAVSIAMCAGSGRCWVQMFESIWFSLSISGTRVGQWDLRCYVSCVIFPEINAGGTRQALPIRIWCNKCG